MRIKAYFLCTYIFVADTWLHMCIYYYNIMYDNIYYTYTVAVSTANDRRRYNVVKDFIILRNLQL